MTAGSASFATAHWVIDRVHNDATYTRTAAEPAGASCLAGLFEGVVGVADSADGSLAGYEDETSLARGHLDDSVVAITSRELSERSGTSSDDATLSRAELDVVDDSAERNGGEREGIADLGSYFGAGANCLAYLEAVGSEDLAFFAIFID